MQFKLTLDTYYEAVFRELAVIRPFRMMSPLVLPNIAENKLSHNRWRCEGPKPRTDAQCFPRPFPVNCLGADGTSPPPYMEECRYDNGATVSEVLFTKFAGHR